MKLSILAPKNKDLPIQVLNCLNCYECENFKDYFVFLNNNMRNRGFLGTEIFSEFLYICIYLVWHTKIRYMVKKIIFKKYISYVDKNFIKDMNFFVGHPVVNELEIKFITIWKILNLYVLRQYWWCPVTPSSGPTFLHPFQNKTFHSIESRCWITGMLYPSKHTTSF